MLNWFYTYQCALSHDQVYGVIITPSISNLKFTDVRDQLILPYLKSNGVNNPYGLTYARAKYAPKDTPRIDAFKITHSIYINGIEFSMESEQYYVNDNDLVGSLHDSAPDNNSAKMTVLHDSIDFKDLFSQWKEAHRQDDDYFKDTNPMVEKTSFVEDGMINPEVYNRAKIKILFILKEANIVFDKNTGETGKYTAFRSIITWINEVISRGTYHELIETIKGMHRVIYQIIRENPDPIEGIAYMNLNKRGGGGTANSKVLRAYTNKYKDFINKEISLLNPDYAICCGNGCYEYVSQIVLGEKVFTPYFKTKDTLYVKARHPSYSYMSTADKIIEFQEQFSSAYNQ